MMNWRHLPKAQKNQRQLFIVFFFRSGSDMVWKYATRKPAQSEIIYAIIDKFLASLTLDYSIQ